LLTIFYKALCLIYTGNKREAYTYLTKILSISENNKLKSDCKSWIKRLHDPLKIKIAFINNCSNSAKDNNQLIIKAIRNSGMYEISDISYNKRNILFDTITLNRYLEAAGNKGNKIVLFVDNEFLSRNIDNSNLPQGDSAMEYCLNLNIKAYGTKNKKIVADFDSGDCITMLPPYFKSNQTNIDLLKRISDRMVMTLLSNDIF